MTEFHLSDEQLAACADGTLPQVERGDVERHLADCARCSAQLAWLRTLATQTAALPHSLAPERELWDGIAPRLDRPGVIAINSKRRISPPPSALAAAAVLLIVVSAAATRFWIGHQAQSVAGTGTVPIVAPTGTDPQALALTRLVSQVRQLEQSLPPATRALVARDLQLIDAAIAESEQALAGRPGNAAVERMLEARYQQRLELLEQARRAAPES